MTSRAPLRAAAAGTIIAILAILVLAADQLAKYFAIQNLPPEEPVHIIGDFLIFYLIRNSGAAFSLGEGVTGVFTLALIAVAIAIVWLMITRVRSRAWAIVLGLLLGGVLGNLTDRMFREPGFGVGHVVDFINTPWMMPAIYNVADMFIVTSMIAVATLVFVGLRLDGTREKRSHTDDDATLVGADEDALPADEVSVTAGDPLFPVSDGQAGVPIDQIGLPPIDADPVQIVPDSPDASDSRRRTRRGDR